jgi:hypothetical protein
MKKSKELLVLLSLVSASVVFFRSPSLASSPPKPNLKATTSIPGLTEKKIQIFKVLSFHDVGGSTGTAKFRCEEPYADLPKIWYWRDIAIRRSSAPVFYVTPPEAAAFSNDTHALFQAEIVKVIPDIDSILVFYPSSHYWSERWLAILDIPSHEWISMLLVNDDGVGFSKVVEERHLHDPKFKAYAEYLDRAKLRFGFVTPDDVKMDLDNPRWGSQTWLLNNSSWPADGSNLQLHWYPWDDSQCARGPGDLSYQQYRIKRSYLKSFSDIATSDYPKVLLDSLRGKLTSTNGATVICDDAKRQWSVIAAYAEGRSLGSPLWLSGSDLFFGETAGVNLETWKSTAPPVTVRYLVNSGSHETDMNVSADTIPFTVNGRPAGEAIFLRTYESQQWYSGGDVLLRYADGRAKSFPKAWENKPPRIGVFTISPGHEDFYFEDHYLHNGPAEVAHAVLCPQKGELLKVRIGRSKFTSQVELEYSPNYRDPHLAEERKAIEQVLLEEGETPLPEIEKSNQEETRRQRLFEEGQAAWDKQNGAVKDGPLEFITVKTDPPENEYHEVEAGKKRYLRSEHSVLAFDSEAHRYDIVFHSAGSGLIDAVVYSEPYLIFGVAAGKYPGAKDELVILNLKNRHYQRHHFSMPDDIIHTISTNDKEIILNDDAVGGHVLKLKRPAF